MAILDDKGNVIIADSAIVQSSRNASSLLTRRRALADKIGLTSFEGRRDQNKSLGYKEVLTPSDYRYRYTRGGIAGRVVDIFPKATWVQGISINEDPNPDVETEFEKQIKLIFKRLDLWAELLRADILAGLGRYSVLLLGCPGDFDSPLFIPPGTVQPIGEKPVTRLTSPDQIAYVTPLGEDKAKIVKVVGQTLEGKLDTTQQNNPRFGLPEIYQCTIGTSTSTVGNNNTTNNGTLVVNVHWTRVIHLAHNKLDSKTYGSPDLERVWNRLDDLDKILGGGSEAAWNLADPGMIATLDPTVPLLPGDEERFEDQIEEFRDKQRKQLLLRGVTVDRLQANVTGFGSNADCITRHIAASNGVPYRILSGAEVGKLASINDDATFNDSAIGRWHNFGAPLTGLVVQTFVDIGVIIQPRELEIVWPEEEELSEVEKANAVGTIAAANAAQHASGQPNILTTNEIRDKYYELPPVPDLPPSTVVPNVNGGSDPMTDPVTGLPRAASNQPFTTRVLIIGGPRRGKSTLAKQYRAAGTPTFCGDPINLVKDPESDVTYLPANLQWSESSQYIADNWLTQPGPWCCEGVAMARAVRKLVANDKQSQLNGVEIIVLNGCTAETTPQQEAMAKGVHTVWCEIADLFPDAKIIGGSIDNKQVAAVASVKHTKDKRKNCSSPPRFHVRVM